LEKTSAGSATTSSEYFFRVKQHNIPKINGSRPGARRIKECVLRSCKKAFPVSAEAFNKLRKELKNGTKQKTSLFPFTFFPLIKECLGYRVKIVIESKTARYLFQKS
jgi:hypothetical protein